MDHAENSTSSLGAKLQIKYLSDTKLLHTFFSELESVSSSAAFRANLAQRFQNKIKGWVQHPKRYGKVTCLHGLCPQRLLVFRAHVCWRVIHLVSIFLVFMFQINEGSQVCSSCGTKLSEYFCFKCKHFTGVHKNPFHCDKCGICRYVVSVLPFNALSVYVLLSTCLLICLFTCLSVFCLFVSKRIMYKRIFMPFLGSQIVTQTRLNKPARKK